MFKRYLSILCALLLLMLTLVEPFALAEEMVAETAEETIEETAEEDAEQADEVSDEQQEFDYSSKMPVLDESASVIVAYLPTSKEGEIVATARYAASAIQSRYYSFSAITLNYSGKLDSNVKNFDNLISATDVSGNISKKGFSASEAEKLTATDKITHIWVIMDVSASKTLENESTLIQQLSSMLNNSNISVTLLMIGDTSFSPKNASAVANLLKEFPKQATWIQLQSDFLSLSVPQQDTLHTGNWFTAALYGTPVDISLVTTKEGETQSEEITEAETQKTAEEVPEEHVDESVQEKTETFTFTMPVNGQAFIVTQQNDTAVFPNVSSESENKKFSSGNKKDKTNFVVTMMSGLEKDTSYDISFSEEAELISIRVYCFPDFSKLNLKLDFSDVLYRTEQKAVLSADEKAFGFGERFRVQWYVNGDLSFGSAYDDASGSWTFAYTPQSEDTSVQLYSIMKLFSADGDLLYTWKSETIKSEVANSELKIMNGTETTIPLYYFVDGNDVTDFIEIAITAYLDYNQNDSIVLKINDHVLSEESSFNVGEGCRLAYDDNRKVATISILDESKAAQSNEPFELKLEASVHEDSVSQTITIQPYCINKLAQDQTIEIHDESNNVQYPSTDAENSQPLAICKEYTLSVSINQENASVWEKLPARENTAGLPRIENLTCVLTTLTKEEMLESLNKAEQPEEIVNEVSTVSADEPASQEIDTSSEGSTSLDNSESSNESLTKEDFVALSDKPTNMSQQGLESGLLVTIPYIKNGKTYSASSPISFDDKWANEAEVKLNIYTVYQDQEGKYCLLEEESVQCKLQNNPPKLASGIDPTSKETIEVRLTGLPNQLNESDINLLEAFGIGSIKELFSDAETPDTLTYYLSVNDAEGVRVKQDETELTPTENDSTLFKINGSSQSLEIGLKSKGDKKITVSASDSVNEASAETSILFHVISNTELVIRYVLYCIAGLAALAIILLIIIKIRQPAFGDVWVKCVACSIKAGSESMLSKAGNSINLKPFKKKKIALSQLLLMARQIALSQETSTLTEDIKIAPRRNGGIVLLFGKKAKKALNLKRKKVISSGERYSIRHDRTVIILENIQGGDM